MCGAKKKTIHVHWNHLAFAVRDAIQKKIMISVARWNKTQIRIYIRWGLKSISLCIANNIEIINTSNFLIDLEK